ncbi:hypothetical protein BDF22DRAFT_742088 [Syncephalis plumigaleata]|nr:hypothetical protein BDF22DRAFT_742088 [Syncephalis plumigaleata]
MVPMANSNGNGNVHQVTVIDLRSNMTSHVQESTWTNAEHNYAEPVNWDHNLRVQVANAMQASAMNGTLLNNPAPVVEVEKQDNRNTLWLGGFHNDTVSEQEVRQFFGPLGDAIVNVKLMFDRNTRNQRAFCFVEFDSERTREQAMQFSGRTLKGHTIKLNPAAANQPTTNMTEPNFVNPAVKVPATNMPTSHR